MDDNTRIYHIKQRYGKNEWSEHYSVLKDGKSIQKRTADEPRSRNTTTLFTRIYVSILQVMREVFLPEGYPDTVSSDYLAYQFWDTLQAFCSSINNILATQGVLKGSGIGDVKATVMAATVTWLLKSGSGMLGSILFAWTRGSHLDCYCKQWRFSADVLNDFAIFVEILAPLVGPDYFLYVMCISAIAKSIVGVAGGSTRAAVTSHQARHGNMADVSAKDGSQETVVNLSALVIGLVMIPIVNENTTTIWSLYIVLTALHLYANYRAVRAIEMEFVNLIRLQILIKFYLTSGRIKSIQETNREEPICLNFFTRSNEYELGAKLTADGSNQLFCLERGLFIQKKRGKISIVLEENFSTVALLESIFYAELYIYLQYKPTNLTTLSWTQDPELNTTVMYNELKPGSKDYIMLFQDFNIKFNKSDWNADVIKVSTTPWRYEQY
ncbi:hypothetical protein LOD99_169 [Oopsacas minuta]|uniref:RUS family member 1 n=1 Tax=Oopsacas minuta TaxID=111878 RepID=A0AAV7K8S3_9METZ|nr:hypothetical protein LOD99_169 [Oopsacas minuta]